MWGPQPSRRCKRGEDLEEWILQEGLEVRNQGQNPTFVNKRCQTFIDLTLTFNLECDLSDWNVSLDFNGSDHNTITFTLLQEVKKIDPVWNWKKAEWDKFTHILKQSNIRIPEKMNERLSLIHI